MSHSSLSHPHTNTNTPTRTHTHAHTQTHTHTYTRSWPWKRGVWRGSEAWQALQGEQPHLPLPLQRQQVAPAQVSEVVALVSSCQVSQLPALVVSPPLRCRGASLATPSCVPWCIKHGTICLGTTKRPVCVGSSKRPQATSS